MTTTERETHNLIIEACASVDAGEGLERYDDEQLARLSDVCCSIDGDTIILSGASYLSAEELSSAINIEMGIRRQWR